MEHTIVTSKQVRQRLGTYLLDLKYKPDDIIVVEKPGFDDWVCVLANPQLLRDQGVKIPEKSESKPAPKKKK
jgi:hypothetical protein